MRNTKTHTRTPNWMLELGDERLVIKILNWTNCSVEKNYWIGGWMLVINNRSIYISRKRWVRSSSFCHERDEWRDYGSIRQTRWRQQRGRHMKDIHTHTHRERERNVVGWWVFGWTKKISAWISTTTAIFYFLVTIENVWYDMDHTLFKFFIFQYDSSSNKDTQVFIYDDQTRKKYFDVCDWWYILKKRNGIVLQNVDWGKKVFWNGEVEDTCKHTHTHSHKHIRRKFGFLGYDPSNWPSI